MNANSHVDVTPCFSTFCFVRPCSICTRKCVLTYLSLSYSHKHPLGHRVSRSWSRSWRMPVSASIITNFSFPAASGLLCVVWRTAWSAKSRLLSCPSCVDDQDEWDSGRSRVCVCDCGRLVRRGGNLYLHLSPDCSSSISFSCTCSPYLLHLLHVLSRVIGEMAFCCNLIIQYGPLAHTFTPGTPRSHTHHIFNLLYGTSPHNGLQLVHTHLLILQKPLTACQHFGWFLRMSYRV